MFEYTVYHVYRSEDLPVEEPFVVPQIPLVPENKPEPGFGSKLVKFLNRLAIILAAIGLIFVLIAYVPEINSAVQKIAGAASAFQLSHDEVDKLSETEAHEELYQPAFDPKLSKTNKLVIPSIGVDAEIQESTYDSYEEALKKGVWRVSDFGAPDARQMPTIFAAHRYGYLAWSYNFRKTNSFLFLPKVKIGETVTIIWQQRKYVYEVYSESKGDEISDYSADLILYTCESLTGSVRIFKYARLLEI